MTTKEFILKALEGGWTPKGLNCKGKFPSYIKQAALKNSYYIERYVLDPKMWEAVGKIEGWWFDDSDAKQAFLESQYGEKWKYCMKAMIDALIEGKTIEEYLESL